MPEGLADLTERISQETRLPGPRKPSGKSKPKQKPKKKNSSKAREGKGKKKSKQPDGDPSSSDSSSSNSDEFPKRKPSSESELEDDTSSASEISDKESRDTRFPGLKEIKPRNEIFKEALSYKSYRLNNHSQRYDSKVARDLYSYCKKVKPDVPEEFYFSGQDPLAILRFLTSFKLGCNHNGISEGAALRMLPKFMTGQAQRNMINFTSRAPRTIAHITHMLFSTYS